MQFIDKLLYRKNLINYGLLPLSWLYQFIIFLRRCCYKYKLFKTTRFHVPIIIVGNLTVGGTGKTPCVIYLVHLLKQQGFKPGIVSRGYGGRAAQYPFAVTSSTDPAQAGDEPVLIVQRTGCPVYIAPDRVAAVRQLLQEQDCNIIVSDDGLQHYALARDIEIVIIDGARRLGNGYYLPAGPLREGAGRLNTVDFVINNGASAENEYSLQLIPQRFVQLSDPNHKVDAAYFNGKTLHAVAGIGHPPRFFAQLRQLGLNIIEHAFSDHQAYTADAFSFANNDIVIMTEKDAVKCAAFATAQFWYLPVHAEIDAQFRHRFLEKINILMQPSAI